MEFLTDFFEEGIKYIMDPTLISPGFASFWSTVRAIFLGVSAILLGLIIFLLSVNSYTEYRFGERYFEMGKMKPKFNINIRNSWKEVTEQASSGDDSERRLAVIEADDITNDVFNKLGYEGDTLYDKLAILNKDIVLNIEELKEAYKKKKSIAHNPNIEVSKEEAKKIVSIYEETLRDLEIL